MSEQEYLEDNIATLAFHLAQPDARLSVSHSGPGLVIEPGEVLREASRRLGAAQRPFYGAECPSYPDCSGGCGLGCTKEIERTRGLAQPSPGRQRVAEYICYRFLCDRGDCNKCEPSAVAIEHADTIAALYASPPSPVAGEWTADQFWEYAEGLLGSEWLRDQMRDMMACKGLVLSSIAAPAETTRNLAESICDDCPPAGYPTDKTRCLVCPRRTSPIPSTTRVCPDCGKRELCGDECPHAPLTCTHHQDAAK